MHDKLFPALARGDQNPLQALLDSMTLDMSLSRSLRDQALRHSVTLSLHEPDEPSRITELENKITEFASDLRVLEGAIKALIAAIEPKEKSQQSGAAAASEADATSTQTGIDPGTLPSASEYAELKSNVMDALEDLQQATWL